MDLLPIFLNIKDRKCVIVGGGKVALRKAVLLANAGGRLHIIAETVCEELATLCAAHQAVVRHKAFDASDIDDAQLVIAATDNPDVNKLVSELARTRQVPVNVVDEPDLCSFIMPAIVDRSPVIIAISTGGTSPVLTRKLKALNESMIPGRIGNLARLLGRFRENVKQRFPIFADRIRFWENTLESTVPELVYSGQEEAAESILHERLKGDDVTVDKGEVYLVGAGPGDPDLLTLRALRLMHKADVVLYDRLVSKEVMAKLRPDAERIHVGKERAMHTVDQETINQMLVRLALEGKKVLRLKGGDPFIFGRGGEELATLTKYGIPFQVVPGITAASGCAAYAGIPLTHRDHAQSVRFLTGHLKAGELELDWDMLVREQQTLVFYMGLIGLQKICDQLIAHGMSVTMPAAVIQQGTTSNQKVVIGTIADLPALVAEHELIAPTLTIIGHVVTLRKELSWFKDQQ